MKNSDLHNTLKISALALYAIMITFVYARDAASGQVEAGEVCVAEAVELVPEPTPGVDMKVIQESVSQPFTAFVFKEIPEVTISSNTTEVIEDPDYYKNLIELAFKQPSLIDTEYTPEAVYISVFFDSEVLKESVEKSDEVEESVSENVVSENKVISDNKVSQNSTSSNTVSANTVSADAVSHNNVTSSYNGIPVEWNGSVLTKRKGVNQGPSGKETYYNLPMDGIIKIMRGMGNTDEHWIREDGVHMLGDYVMVAANLSVHPRGSYVETSLGMACVCDTGGFAKNNPTQIDIATTW